MTAANILTNLATLLCMLIDSLMISRYLGVNAIAAYGFAAPVILVFTAVGSMLSGGIQIVCGRTMGRGDREGSDRCFSTTIVLCALVAVLMTALAYAFLPGICTLLGAGRPGDPVYRMTKDYLTGILPGVPLFVFVIMMAPYLAMCGKRGMLTAAVVSMTAADVLFDTLNVFVFRGGMLGMGLASSAGYLTAFLFIPVFLFGRGCSFSFSFSRVRAKVCGLVLKAGVPAVLSQLCLVVLTYGMNAILKSIGGTDAVAAYSVISTVGNFSYALGGGIGSVALMLGSVMYGEQNRDGLKTVLKCAFWESICLSVPVTVLVFAAAPLLVRLFLTDAGTLNTVTRTGMRLFILCIPFSTVNASVKNYANGVGHPVLTQLISALQNLILPLLFAFTLSRMIRLNGAWLSFVCGETLTLALYLVYVRLRYGRIGLDSLTLLPDGFGPDPSCCMDLLISTKEQAAQASEKVRSFARQQGKSERDSMLLSLCTEEILMNVVSHGGGSAELRVIVGKEETLLRFRDDSGRFDSVEYARLHRDEDPTAHIGLRMVMKMVSDAVYVDSMGLNNLTLKIRHAQTEE